MAKNIIFNLFFKLYLNTNINKKKDKYCTGIFQTINKYWNKIYYEQFFWINKINNLDKFF